MNEEDDNGLEELKNGLYGVGLLWAILIIGALI